MFYVLNYRHGFKEGKKEGRVWVVRERRNRDGSHAKT